MRPEDFDYELPEERIAQEPATERDAARLLVHDRAGDATQHRIVRDLPEILRPGDLLVVNDTRVLAARLFARRASGGRVELLLVEPADEPPEWRALAHPARRLGEGERLALEGGGDWGVRMLGRDRDASGKPEMEWRVRFEDAGGGALDAEAVLARAGHVPLPPYVARPDAPRDAERYQTVYARTPGAVAAPTAGLHFTPALLARLAERGIERTAVTLHVGPGTFQPVKAARLEDHVMHSERYVLPQAAVDAVRAARGRGGRVVAIGTTAVRVLESCADERGELVAGRGATRLFLYPGARFRVVDALLTNFHLPRSTLLMLVSAFAGRERVLRLYAEALAARYRFYSYGDAMLLL